MGIVWNLNRKKKCNISHFDDISNHVIPTLKQVILLQAMARLAYDLLSLINVQVKCNLPTQYYTYILMNSLGLKTNLYPAICFPYLA